MESRVLEIVVHSVNVDWLPLPDARAAGRLTRLDCVCVPSEYR